MRLFKVLCVTLGMLLCISTPLMADDAKVEPKAADDAKAAPDVAAKDKVIARVGDEVITMADFESMMGMVPPQYRSQMTSPQAKRQLLNQIIEGMLLAKEARRLELDKKERTIYMIKSSADQVLIRELVKELQANLDISQEEIKSYYDQNTDKFQSPPQIKARHILVKTEEEAKAIRAELDNGGDFATIAKEKSIGPSKDKGGDLGWFGKGRMVKPFEEVAFALKNGETSQPVNTRFGWHIIRVDESKPAGAKPLQEAQVQIHTTLVQERTKTAMKEIRERWEKEVKVEVAPDVFQAE